MSTQSRFCGSGKTLAMAVLAASLLVAGSPAMAQPAKGPTPAAASMAHTMPNASFMLRTGIAQGKMVYIGKGGALDGQVNPTLTVHRATSCRSP